MTAAAGGVTFDPTVGLAGGPHFPRLSLMEGLIPVVYLPRLSLTAVAAAAALAACSVVQATPDRIVVQFNTYHPEFAFSEATQHCSQFGKKPVLIRTEAVAPSAATLFTNTSASTFDCVTPTQPYAQ